MRIEILALWMILIPFLSGPLCFLLSHTVSDRHAHRLAEAAAFAEMVPCILIWYCRGMEGTIPVLGGFGLQFQATGFQLILMTLAYFLWLMTTLFCPYYFRGHHGAGRYQLFSFLTEGAIMGVFLSADFVTLLLFFEIMSVTSWVMVIHEQTPGAIDAAASYLGFAIIGGLCTMMGLFLLDNMAGTLKFTELLQAAPTLPRNTARYVAGILIMFGFAAKAGMWPLHTWLPAAHPAAPATASALLSGIITKAGVFGVCAVCANLFFTDHIWGNGLLVFATITMFTGAVLAIFSVDLKRTLACSSMSQIGFIMVGIAMQCLLGKENTLAVYGTVLHICNHSLLKLCLFLCAGVLVHCCHSRDLNVLKGFGRNKPVFLAAFAMGTLGITCMPLFGGYISKTLLHESILEYIELIEEYGGSVLPYKIVEILFLCSGGFTVAYMTKLFVALFVDKNENQEQMDRMKRNYLGIIPAAVLLIAGLTSPILGSLPHLTMDKIAEIATSFFHASAPEHAVHYFAWENLKGAVISLLVGGVTYFGFIRKVLIRDGKYVDVWPKWLDLERGIYRPLLLKVLPTIGAVAARIVGNVFDWCFNGVGALLRRHDATIAELEWDNEFGVYHKDTDNKRGNGATLSYGLMTACMVIVATLCYVLLYRL